MLSIILALLPKIGPVAAALPEFKALIDQVLGTLKGNDQETLKQAYALAIQKSDAAHADLQQLVAEKTSGQ